MESTKRKASLNDNQVKYLKRLRVSQVGLEIGFVSLLVTALTVNISAAFPLYALIVLLLIILSSLAILIFGILISIAISELKKSGQPVSLKSQTPHKWMIAAWISIAVVLALTSITFTLNDGEIPAGGLVIVIVSLAAFFIACFGTIISAHLLWRRFNKKTSAISPRYFVYGSLGLVLLLTALLGNYTTTERLAYKQITSSDANLELGQSEVRQIGKDGQKETRRNLLLGFVVSSNQTEAVDEITAKGTKRYQYMHCSDGTYRYYSTEDFKNPAIGFTHQSPDYCAQNGNGTQIAVADTPPAEKITQQVPVYRTPSYHSTTCTPSYFGNSVTCSGWY